MKTQDTRKAILYSFFKNIAQNYAIIDPRKSALRPGAENNPLYKANEKILDQRLEKGWKIEDIASKILDAKELRIKVVFLSYIVPEQPPLSEREDQNLVSDGHYHVMLKEYKPPLYDYETDELISPGSVERKKVFTLGELITYYFDKLKPDRVNRKDVSVVMRVALGKDVKVDHLLTAIDLWKDESTEVSRGNDPWMLLNKYVSQAQKEELELGKRR